MKILWCWRCKMEIPMLDDDEFERVIGLRNVGRGDLREQHVPVLEEYNRITGFDETNANAVYHHKLSLYGPPCRNCGKPLRSRWRSCAGRAWLRLGKRMPFTIKTVNAFEMTGRMSACEVPASRVGHRAFVGVYPPRKGEPDSQWLIRRFEIPTDLVDQSFGEDSLVDNQYLRVGTMEEVEAVLVSWGVDSSTFDAPWRNDWPL